MSPNSSLERIALAVHDMSTFRTVAPNSWGFLRPSHHFPSRPSTATFSAIDNNKSKRLGEITIDLQAVPQHIAVIMDGNARWARKRGTLVSAGHEAGMKAIRELTRLCCDFGVKILTVFAFSCDNWSRPRVEVEFLMLLFEKYFKLELENFERKGIRVSTVGDLSGLPLSLTRVIQSVEDTTRKNTKLHLIVALNYSGKKDLVQACRSIAGKVKDGVVELKDIDDNLIEQELQTGSCTVQNPDLLIRSGGEQRLSNFLLWQLAYTELFFVQTLWPDFGETDFLEALASFQQRRRRYGGRP